MKQVVKGSRIISKSLVMVVTEINDTDYIGYIDRDGQVGADTILSKSMLSNPHYSKDISIVDPFILSELNSEKKILAAEVSLQYGYRSIFEIIKRSDKAHHLDEIYRNGAGNYVHVYNGETLYFAWPVDLFSHLSSIQ